MPTCKLCRSEKKLLKSHVIPEFMYASMYDENHRFQRISSLQDEFNPRKQKGEWDRLLCSDCEQRISKFERYASLLLNGGAAIEPITEHLGVIKVSGIDYKLFKLFQLSILWRAGVSTRPIFEMVDLGKHEETIRNMLLNENPGESDQYGCIMFAAMFGGKHVDSLILQPELVRVEKQIVYRFLVGGFWWLYFCSSHKPNKQFASGFLQSSGVVNIFPKALDSAEHVVRFAALLKQKSFNKEP